MTEQIGTSVAHRTCSAALKISLCCVGRCAGVPPGVTHPSDSFSSERTNLAFHEIPLQLYELATRACSINVESINN